MRASRDQPRFVAARYALPCAVLGKSEKERAADGNVVVRNARAEALPGELDMGEVHQLVTSEPSFGLQAAGRLLTTIFAPWVQDLALLVESVEPVRPPGAPHDWQPGAVVRLPFSNKICCDGKSICSQALMALADSAMVIACSAAWNGYRPMSTIDQTTHFLRPVTFDVIADARVVRIGRNTSFGRVMLLGASDKRPVGMVASAYSML